MEWLPARDSVQMWMIFVQFVKLNFRSQFFSSVSTYFVRSVLLYGLSERKPAHCAELSFQIASTNGRMEPRHHTFRYIKLYKLLRPQNTNFIWLLTVNKGVTMVFQSYKKIFPSCFRTVW